jgi:hypothetical protein
MDPNAFAFPQRVGGRGLKKVGCSEGGSPLTAGGLNKKRKRKEKKKEGEKKVL